MDCITTFDPFEDTLRKTDLTFTYESIVLMFS